MANSQVKPKDHNFTTQQPLKPSNPEDPETKIEKGKSNRSH